MSPDARLGTAELLTFLRARGGQEFSAVACLTHGQGKRQRVTDQGLYHFTARGEVIEATGPSGQPRTLTPARFQEVFGSHQFHSLRPTGRLTDLGPLFA
ncbi:hypothetical protein [Deinococcus cavernae]|uniref:hypothetical protein n=1 Tax=Deinococcus cavernae TaxID=2320857 RepID=UPI001F3704CF|nr:hypothetical protein [Deinococcus cavernae]